ncbi:DUF3899 domain-containing protein [[Bacillus] enclensis]|uniref:DUF3899 domain-containing protein n=1 Tax=[Bacillus] enclensis TaxID=1402860 RepID=UPI0018DCE07D|nr:DUF3899 domain-containing protein [[Bacillus] enclensis]MBH9966384.1 DUF3899 domain-containing protein [[Bacillus] enclensis]
MKRIVNIYLIAVIILIASLTVSLAKGDTYMLSFINSLFIAGIIYFIAGAFLYIFQKGFFNGIIYSLKRFRRSTTQGKYVSQFDDLDDTKEAHVELSVIRSYRVTRSLLGLGGILLIISLALSYLLYT